MQIGYQLSIQNDGGRMFQDDSSLQKCPECGYRLDFFAHNPQYYLRGDMFDLGFTYDGQLLCSLGFKRFCEHEGYTGIRFLEFNLDERHFHMILENIIPFDPVRRRTRFEKLCNTCGNYESVVGATPSYFLMKEPLKDGFFRSDLLFASGNEKSPLKVIGNDTKLKMENARLRGIYYKPAIGLD